MTLSMYPLVTFKEMDNLLDSFFNAAPWQSCWRKSEPGFPIHEQRVEEDTLTIRFALAGYPKESLQVTASGNTLEVFSGKIEGEEGSTFACRSFTKSFKDTQGDWDFEKTHIEYKDGMLTLVIPKAEKFQTKQLKINQGEK